MVTAALYAWAATGVRPFGASAYLYVAVAAVLAVSLFAARGGFGVDARPVHGEVPAQPAPSWRGWLVLALAGLGLEVAGLALGGRSRSVPTLSTTIDHLLTTHAGRAALFVLWLSAGAAAILTARRRPEVRA